MRSADKRLMTEVCWLLGLPVDVVTSEQAIERIRSAAATREQLVVATPNVNFLVLAAQDPGFRRWVLESDLVIADGMPLVWLGRLLGIPIPERVAGSGLVERLMASDAAPLSMFFMGGEEHAAARAARAVDASAGGLRAAGHLYPGFGSIESMSTDAVLGEINASGADFLSVSLGARRGLEWIARNRTRLEVPVLCHLGAVVNFLAGTVRRAPPWMQRCGLEWLWRVIEEPALAKRYLLDGVALLRLVVRSLPELAWRRLAAARQPRGSRYALQRVDAADRVSVRIAGVVDRSAIAAVEEIIARLDAGVRCDIELGELRWIDPAALGYLYSLRHRRADLEIRLRCTERSALRLIRLHGAACLFD